MSRLPDPADLNRAEHWCEADELQRIVGQVANALRERHPDAARQVDHWAQQYRSAANGIRMAGR